MAAFEIVNSNGVEVQCQVLCSTLSLKLNTTGHIA